MCIEVDVVSVNSQGSLTRKRKKRDVQRVANHPKTKDRKCERVAAIVWRTEYLGQEVGVVFCQTVRDGALGKFVQSTSCTLSRHDAVDC